jgi:hypothetical protein
MIRNHAEENMRRIITATMLLFLMASAASAQGSDERKGWGYAVAGVGGLSGSSTAFFHAGGGGERLVYKGLGVGADIGYFAPFRRLGDGIGLLSVNPSYHINRSKRLVPFVTGGFSLAFRQSASGGGNFGGGVQYWAGDRVGLRFEFRDHIFSSDNPHFFSFRAGILFR